MPARYPCPLDGVARKWVALAERRTAHIVELYDTGRWRHYSPRPNSSRRCARPSASATNGQGSPDEDEAADAAEKPARRMNGR
jgi:hypothetical protein